MSDGRNKAKYSANLNIESIFFDITKDKLFKTFLFKFCIEVILENPFVYKAIYEFIE